MSTLIMQLILHSTTHTHWRAPVLLWDPQFCREVMHVSSGGISKQKVSEDKPHHHSAVHVISLLKEFYSYYL